MPREQGTASARLHKATRHSSCEHKARCRGRLTRERHGRGDGPTLRRLQADGRRGAVDVLLLDGTVATVRSLASSDHNALIALDEAVSDDNLRLRFFVVSRYTGRSYAEHLIRSDPREVFSLVALRNDELMAVASCEILAPDTAEVAFLVADQAHGLGLGTILLEHVASAARDRGIRRFVADVLPDNTSMLRVLTDAGFDSQRRLADGLVSPTQPCRYPQGDRGRRSGHRIPVGWCGDRAARRRA